MASHLLTSFFSFQLSSFHVLHLPGKSKATGTLNFVFDRRLDGAFRTYGRDSRLWLVWMKKGKHEDQEGVYIYSLYKS